VPVIAIPLAFRRAAALPCGTPSNLALPVLAIREMNSDFTHDHSTGEDDDTNVSCVRRSSADSVRRDLVAA
jgi:hypothetical protein